MRKCQKKGLNQLRTKRSGVRVPPGAPAASCRSQVANLTLWGSRFFLPAFFIDIYFITLTQGFSQESCGSWDFSFSGKRLPFSRFTHNLRTTFSKRTAKGEKQARLGSASRLFLCLFFPGPMLSSEAPRPQCTRWRLHRPGQSGENRCPWWCSPGHGPAVWRWKRCPRG